MSRRIIAAAAAVVLAITGAAISISYAKAADERAMAGQKPTTVLVVAEEIKKGMSPDQVVDLIEEKELPAIAVQEDAFTSVESLDAVDGLVVTADLKPGEQLIAGRFAHPETLAAPEVEVPQGMRQLSVLLEPQRVIGGHLEAGATVGVFVSMPKTDEGPSQTHLIHNNVLVTRVQGGIQPPTEPTADGAAEQAALTTPPEGESAGAPAEMIIVTLALNGADAEKVVFGQEHGSVWLSLEPADANVDGTQVITRENLYQ